MGHPPAYRLIFDQIDRIEAAPLPSKVCPGCGGRLPEVEVVTQHQTDLPPIQPITTRFEVEVGTCQNCVKRVQGRHPDQTSDALGERGGADRSPCAGIGLCDETPAGDLQWQDPHLLPVGLCLLP
ncbi:MAG: IS66 family transposase zinc-finger binding domain-containing protein [Candidatus Handelsmanbacteria bacterium]|nr:IS66 family transposase zinc-finger binding domain-containing protein [Candidatus Handelsmanbacteria bacterium]